MKFSTHHHKQYCGIALPARALSICLLDQSGTILVQKHLPTTPAAFLRVIAPDREDLGVAVEGMFTWYWLAARCAQEGRAFILGHALAMTARHGGKAQNAKLAAPKSAVLLGGGMRPQAAG